MNAPEEIKNLLTLGKLLSSVTQENCLEVAKQIIVD